MKSEILRDKFVFGVVSRLRQEKGVDLLIEAFAKLAQEKDNVHLHIVGTGPDRKQLSDKAIELNVVERVSFFGEASWKDAMQQMALMDVVVVPSRFEGFGLTAAEALAMGTPVIASNVFGLLEVVSDENTGYLFENGSFLDLYNKMKKMYENKEDYKRFEANSQVYVSRFGLPNFFNKVKILHKLK
jgi:glycosyltransferase involved in cell wall biosynthesis